MHALSQRVSLVALSGLVILSQYGSAQAPPVTDPNAAPSTSSKDFPAEPAELDAFLTPLLTRQLEELHIPGISFVLVKNGRILFMKGYGYADRDRKLPVDPERTVFRVASVSKVVTATAAMQLVERGMLRVDDPVNAQLKAFQIKETFRPPITLGNLLTHTAGFDESAIGRRARSAADLEPLGAYLAHSIPPQVFPAGTVLNYSNHGMALAGYLVEEASGVPFEKYMDENVFKPLGMTRSSFALPEALAQDLALGYEYDDGVYTPRHYEYIKTIPSSMLVTTASDMARFMIAHLQGGRYENTSILGETTVEEMHRRHFTHHPKLAGICYAFLERYYNDQRILWHDGGTYGFTSLLILAPEQNLGFFVAYNIEDSTIARERLVENFFDHYFPVSKPPAPAPMPNASRERASTFAGTYRVSRHGHRGLEKLEALIGKVPETVVTANSDDGITLDGRHLVEVEPLLFQFDSGRGHVAFRQDSQGRVTHLFAGRSTAWAFERLAWYEQRQFHLALCGGTAFVFLVTLLIVPIVRRFRKPVTTPAPAVRRAWRCAYAVSGLNLLFLVCLAATLILWREEVQYQMPKPLVALLYMPVANLILTAALLLTTITLWLKRQALLATRLYHSLLSVSAVAFIWFLLHWNLLKFHY